MSNPIAELELILKETVCNQDEVSGVMVLVSALNGIAIRSQADGVLGGEDRGDFIEILCALDELVAGTVCDYSNHDSGEPGWKKVADKNRERMLGVSVLKVLMTRLGENDEKKR